MSGDDEAAVLEERDPERSWALFLEACTRTVDRVALRVTRDEEEARNVAAEILVRIHADWPALLERFRAACEGAGVRPALRVWLAVVARNLAIDVVRSIHGRPTVPRPIARLPKWQQRLWRLVLVDGRPLTDAAETLRAEGVWSGELGDLAAALDEVRAALPDGATSAGRRRPRLVSAPYPAGDDDDSRGPDPASSETDEPDTTAQRRAAHAALGEILAEFGAEERLVLRLYSLEGLRASQVAQVLGHDSPDRIYELFKKLLARLRRRAEERGLDAADVAALADFDWSASLADGPEASGG
ncbi:MAG: sigma-70 family RNA polymerase sigma factor [Planctomycetota bacterium]